MPAADLDLKPLSARSVVLSLVLGAHPEPLSAGGLIRAGEHFGIAPTATRVALTRAVASGELHRRESDYALGRQLVERQRRQEEAVEDAETAWQGDWELAIVVVLGRPAAERAALRDLLTAHRLAELREGVWTRPANLRRDPAYAADPAVQAGRCTFASAPEELARSLWDLGEWSSRGRRVLSALEKTREPARRLAAAAQVVRHLATDPLLPAALLPAAWPGPDLRHAYAEYQRELRNLALI
ncbi:MAG: PaaX domain-containing protein, C- domain protein [Catenulispora sp.]|nr:PaaX domain-containing protein, C- domain protein [Catenulispora sp.]